MAEADGIARRGWRRPGGGHAATSPACRICAGLDGMRALAVIAVMVYHANSSWLPGGFIGVEVFFVISGYLITLLLIGEHERSGRVRLGQFYLRRARRLLPALFMMLALVVVYTALFKREELGRLRGDVLAALATCPTGSRSGSARDTPPRASSLRSATCGAWPSRSSSTSSGRSLMIALIRAGKGRLPSYSRWLLLAAVAISVAVGLLFEPEPGRSIRRRRPTPTGMSAGTPSPRPRRCTCRRSPGRRACSSVRRWRCCGARSP